MPEVVAGVDGKRDGRMGDFRDVSRYSAASVRGDRRPCRRSRRGPHLEQWKPWRRSSPKSALPGLGLPRAEDGSLNLSTAT